MLSLSTFRNSVLTEISTYSICLGFIAYFSSVELADMLYSRQEKRDIYIIIVSDKENSTLEVLCFAQNVAMNIVKVFMYVLIATLTWSISCQSRNLGLLKRH